MVMLMVIVMVIVRMLFSGREKHVAAKEWLFVTMWRALVNGVLHQ